MLVARLLVATDVIGRGPMSVMTAFLVSGIDIPSVSHVVVFDMGRQLSSPELSAFLRQHR